MFARRAPRKYTHRKISGSSAEKENHFGDGFELFAARLEFFADSEGFLCHLHVHLLRTDDERKVLAGGDSPAAGEIQTDAKRMNAPAIFFLDAFNPGSSEKTASNLVKSLAD